MRYIYWIVSLIYSRMARLCYSFVSLPPLRINIMLTKKCNSRCHFCYVKNRLNTTESNSLSEEEWIKIIDRIPKSAVVVISGGEPFLSPVIYRLIEELDRRKIMASVTTNGTVFSEKQLEFLVDNKLTYLMFSVDGMRDYHNNARGHKDAFQKIMNSIEVIEKIKKEKNSRFPILAFKVCILEDNYDEIPKLLKLAEQKVSHVSFSLLVNNVLQHGFVFVDSLEDPLLVEGNTHSYSRECLENIKSVIEYIMNFKKTSDIEISISPSSYCKSLLDSNFRVTPGKCSIPWSEFSLYYDGTVTPCITYNCGNIRNMDYDVNKVLKSPRYRKFLTYYEKNMSDARPCEACCQT